MNQHRQNRSAVFRLLLLLGLAFAALPVHGQGTAFSYQGSLNQSGGAANGNFNLTFTLKDQSTGGNTVGTPVSLTGVPVENGIFTVLLNFGATAFSSSNRWLEIAVNGTTLSPRQPLTPVPQALGLPNVYSVGGKIGIGTSEPGELLTVNGTIYGTALRIGGLVNTVGGKVGIGTSAPSAVLDVAGGSIRVGSSSSDFHNSGTHIEWNKSGGDGSTWILNRKDWGSGGIRFGELGGWNNNTVSELMRIESNGNVKCTGSMTCTTAIITSDRNKKDGFETVDPREVLEKVAAMPITRWHYRTDTDTRHIGPVAQDFHEAFGLGQDNLHIATVDADGVALAAIQGLYEVVAEKDAEIRDLKTSAAAMEARLSALEDALKSNN